MSLMKAKIIIPILLLIAVVIGILMMNPSKSEVTMLLLNGSIYTLNEKQPMAEAIATESGKIVAVGSTADITAAYQSSSVINLEGRPVYPGFIDSHGHLEGLGASLMNLNLVGTGSVEEIQGLVAERVQGIRQGEWVRGRGWDQNKWKEKSFPTHEMLDKVAPDTPVYLTRVDGHAVWLNTKALVLANITAATRDPDGGKVLRDGSGNPTGVFVDNAINMLDAALPDTTEAERRQSIELAIRECLKVGLTEVHDMGVDLEVIGIYKKLIDAHVFPFRVYVAVDGPREAWRHYLSTGPEINYGDGRLSVRAVKLYADGALGSRGAALIEPYTDDPANRGLTLTTSQEMRSVVDSALKIGFQVCTHAIGDRANHIVLNTYEDGFKSNKINGMTVRFRVEHAQVAGLDDIARFGELGIIPSMQQTHCTSDMYWAEERVGPQRIRSAYAWRSFLEHGCLIPGGSDFPFESPNPLWGFYAAITRQDQKGWPDGGWYPDQKMSREEALKSFTSWAAFAGFQEEVKGSIELGKYADLVVLSDDIMKIEPRKILDTKVHVTMVAGEVVYTDSSLTVSSSR